MQKFHDWNRLIEFSLTLSSKDQQEEYSLLIVAIYIAIHVTNLLKDCLTQYN